MDKEPRAPYGISAANGLRDTIQTWYNEAHGKNSAATNASAVAQETVVTNANDVHSDVTQILEGASK